MNSIINPVLLKERGLKPLALEILQTAVERKQISTQEMVRFLPTRMVQNREEFIETIQWIGAFLRTVGVSIVTGKQEIEHKQQFPVPTERFFHENPWKRDTAPRKVFAGDDWDQIDITSSAFEDDILHLYRQEAKQFPLLSKVEELKLAQRIQEERDLDARDELIKHNLRLVFWLAKRYLWSELEYADLVQEGNVGLIIAAERFDYRMGYRFPTYALWWIRKSISQAIMNTKGMLRLPVHIWELRAKVLRASAELASHLGYPPAEEEIAHYMKEPVHVVQKVLTRLKFDVISLNQAVTDDTEKVFSEAFADESAPDSAIVVEAKEELERSRKNINLLLETLSSFEADFASPRNQAIFKMFYGLDDDSRIYKTLEVVGQRFALTRERARQIVVRLWYELDAAGVDIDHDSLLEELYRLNKLEELIDPR